jgi:SAM-dependent methyltransferase
MSERPDEGKAPGASPPDAQPARIGDAFGACLLDCWEGGVRPWSVLELIERDDGFLDGGDAARYFAPPAAWGALDHWVCDQVRGRVLDVGAGAGRATLHLQATGREAVALDVSPLAVEVCRRRGVQRTVVGTVADLAAAGGHPGGPGGPGGEPFDAFVLLGNNLGLLEGVAAAPRLLGALAALAAPGALLLGQGMDPYRTAAPEHLAYHDRNRTLGRLPGQIRLRVRHRGLATAWFDYLFATPDELRPLLAGTAWRLEHVEREAGQAAGGAYVAVLRCAR